MEKLVNKKYILTTLVAALIIVIAHNLSLDGHIKDVVIPYMVTLASYLYLFKDNKNLNKDAYYYLIPVGLIFLNAFLVEADVTNFLLNIIILALLLTIFIFKWTNKNYKLSLNGFKWIFKLFPDGFFSNLKYLKKSDRKHDPKKVDSVVSGVLIGGAIAIVIIALFASMDSYFSSFIFKFLDIFDLDLSNLILFVISFIFIFSVGVNVYKYREEKVAEIKIKDGDPITANVVLGIINFVFVLYLISVISRITNNFLGIPVDYTYAGYAREGFFQLLAITVINFVVITYLIYKTKLVKSNKTVRTLIYVLVGFSVLLIFTSYYKMALYVTHYGLTTLRLQVVLFLSMDLIMFVMLVVKTLKSMSDDMVKYFLVAITTYILNLYLCNQTMIDFLNSFIK